MNEMKLADVFLLFDYTYYYNNLGFIFLFLLSSVQAEENSTSTDEGSPTSNSTVVAANATTISSDDVGDVVDDITEEPTTTTTIAPLDVPCQCLGDSVLLANQENTRKVLELCRNNSKSRMTVDGRGFVAERYR